MKKQLKFYSVLLAIFAAGPIFAENTPKQFVSPSDKGIVYMGRISDEQPECVRFTYPGVSIFANFEGTSLQMKAKPGSGAFMVCIDDLAPFRINFTEKDSILTLVEGLADGIHRTQIMYAIEGHDLKPEFRGSILTITADWHRLRYCRNVK